MIDVLISATQKEPASAQAISSLKNIVRDNAYIEYMYNYNGGTYCYDALIMYSLLDGAMEENLIAINIFLKKIYENIFINLIAIGQDTFGNQFCFNQLGQLVFVNIESGEIELLGDSFSEWKTLLVNDLDYLTGMSIRRRYTDDYEIHLFASDRLCPKIPFITGGEYDTSNLYHASVENCLCINNNIYIQTKNLDNGDVISIKTIE